MSPQRELFDLTLDQRFADFHAKNPQVYRALLRLARQAAARGVTRLGAKALWERLRWEVAVETTESFPTLNNNYTSRYARLLAREPGLEGLFEVRELRS